MRSRKYFILAGVLFLVLVLNSCGGGGGTPTCPTGSLQAVTLGDPPNWSVVDSLLPALTWTYPDSTCNPEGYAIDLSTGPFFTDDLGGGTGNPSTTWHPGDPLEPGTEYGWGVQPINGTTLGPYAGYHYFFTGPMCATADLTAPTLLEPANGAVITELNPSLIWDYPDPCLPEGYRVDLSIDYTFADTSLSGGTGNPSTRWGPGEPLEDCMVYFWKIAPINDITLGPASVIFSFSTNTTGACPTATPVPTDAPLSFIPNLNANCRSGPGMEYEAIGIAIRDQSYLLDGRSQDGDWFRLMLTEAIGCYVPSTAGTPSGDIADLRVLVDPATPTPTSLPFCSNFTDEKSCESQSACKWEILSVTPGGRCVNK